MIHKKLRSKAGSAAFASLLVLLLIGNLNPIIPSKAVPLAAGDLAHHRGMGFWSDPCTWDGFYVGAGVTLCATGSPGGCLTAFAGIVRAIYVDNCF